MLPDTLLSEPLDQKLVNRLSFRQKRLYTIQKNKYDQYHKKLERIRNYNAMH